jgi:hypothetical protein
VAPPIEQDLRDAERFVIGIAVDSWPTIITFWPTIHVAANDV